MKFVLASALLVCCAAAPAALSNAAQSLAPTQELIVGQSIRGRLIPGQPQRVIARVPTGHVVQGNVIGSDVLLDLVDNQGRHVRRLGAGAASAQTFMWIAADDAQSLVLHGPQTAPGSFELTLTRSLAPAAPDASATSAADAARSADLASPATSLLQNQASESQARIPAPDAAPQSPRLRALNRTLANGGNTHAFWQEVAQQGSPLIEPLGEGTSLVTFLWRGARHNVRLFGGPTRDHDPLMRLGDSDVWWHSVVVSNAARASYRLAPDVPVVQGSAMDNRRVILATAQRDPLNKALFPATPQTAVDLYQGSSVLQLPDAPAQPWVQARAGVPSGTLLRERFTSQILGNERDLWTYVPAGRSPQALLVLFDAEAYLHRVPTPVIIDNLIADGLIPPTAVVLVDNASAAARGNELPPNEAFARFLDQELMPHIAARGLAQPPAQTVIAGSSYGGLASAYAGLVNAKWFGNVLSLSGSYWWAPKGEDASWLTREYATSPRQPVNFYLDAGRYETGWSDTAGILETSRGLGDTLRAKGYTVTQVEHESGHDYLHWQGSLGCGLVALLEPEKWRQLDHCHGVAHALR